MYVIACFSYCAVVADATAAVPAAPDTQHTLRTSREQMMIYDAGHFSYVPTPAAGFMALACRLSRANRSNVFKKLHSPMRLKLIVRISSLVPHINTHIESGKVQVCSLSL